MLGPYQLLSRIGEGGMGVMWKARDTRPDRIVAIKVSKAEFTGRFAREASVAALNHPNIRTLHDVRPNFLGMEFIEGTPLQGPLPVDKAVEYARPVADVRLAQVRVRTLMKLRVGSNQPPVSLGEVESGSA